jgi:hypothetical protein
MKSILMATALILLSLLVPAGEAAAQAKNPCSSYEAAIVSASPSAVPVVPDNLLTNWRAALSCLVPIIAGMKDTMKSGSVPPATRAKYLSTAGAIRAIATRISTGEEANKALPPPQQTSVDTIGMFQAEFRKVQSIDAFAVLTTGARSDNYDMRLTSIVILGNVIDERFTCVPLVQILDPELDSVDYSINARANLLGMLSRVAPFVYKEDFANVQRVKETIGKLIPPGDARFTQTSSILSNIDQRLNAQTDASNRGVPLDGNAKEKCESYMTAYPATERMKVNIKY